MVNTASGRKLCAEQDGDPDGRPVLLLHGGGSSRLFRHPDSRLTARLGVQLITVDRPGTGRSDTDPERSLADWADDVQALMDAIGIGGFDVVGHSQGAPFAVATAAGLKERVRALTIASGLPPLDNPKTLAGLNRFDRAIFALDRRAPSLLSALLQTAAAGSKAVPEAAIKRIFNHAHGPEIGPMMWASSREAVAVGARGIARDIHLVNDSWNLDLGSVTAPVRLFYGADDAVVGESAVEAYQELFGGCEVDIIPGAGHLALLDHWERLLTWRPAGTPTDMRSSPSAAIARGQSGGTP
jgi:pimeloyl-ACP methyl ester carboxylesterase